MATPRITEGMFFYTKVGFILMGGVVWVFDRLRLTKMGRDASCFSMTKIGGRSLGRCFLRQHDKGGGTKFGGLRQAQTDMIDGRECVDASCVSMTKFGWQRWGKVEERNVERVFFWFYGGCLRVILRWLWKIEVVFLENWGKFGRWVVKELSF